MKRLSVIVFAGLLLTFGVKSTAVARQAGVVTSPLVDHPVASPIKLPNAPAYNKMLGAWGEDFAEQTLRLRGYKIYKPSYHGIDRIAIKQAADGAIRDVKFVEVKVTNGNKFQLPNTKYGRQMSREWLAHKLKKMRQSGKPAMTKLAMAISRFRKASGGPIESFGEVMHIDARAGKVTVYEADGKTIKASFSLERVLKDIEKRASSKDARRWAARALAALDQIRAGTMSEWISATVAAAPSRRIAMRVILARAAGPITALGVAAVEAAQFADAEMAYRHGLISLRERNISHITRIGGLSGALGGSWAGGVTGWWLGALGGPFAEFTAPVGALVGATIGGIGGYFAGSAVAGYAATEWYRSIDSGVRERFEAQWVSLPVPPSLRG